MILLCHRYSYSLITIGLVYYFYAIKLVSASYIGPSTGLGYFQPCFAPVAFFHEKKLYTYGGQTYTESATNIFSSVSLSSEENSRGNILYERVNQSSYGPDASYTQGIFLEDSRTAVIFGAYLYGFSPKNQSMSTYTYDFRSAEPSWTQYSIAENATVPEFRVDFTATLAPNKNVYIYGGMSVGSSIYLNDLWSFNPTTFQYINLTREHIMQRSRHTATVLPNGQIVYISGKTVDKDQISQRLISLNEIEIYDTNTGEWIYINATGSSTEGRMDASTALGPDKKTIFFFGGSNLDNIYFNDLTLLDTTTWVWSTPYISGVYPGARSSHSMGFIDTNLLVIAYGGALTMFYKDINILRIDDQENSKYSWLSGPDDLLNVTRTDHGLDQMDKGTIAGITVGAVLLAIILVYCVYKTFTNLYYLPHLLRGFIWDPRRGEPVWTEILRLILQIVLAFLFLAYLVFSIRQALESPTTSIKISTKVPSVQVPDMRFCFEGWGISEDPYGVGSTWPDISIYCTTDKGISCHKLLTRLNTTLHLPMFEDSVQPSECFMFSPPSWFTLGDSSDGYTNGTKLQFLINADTGKEGTIRVTQYPPGMNPNIRIYNINTTDVPVLMSDQAIDEWTVRDTQGKDDANTFTIYPNDALNIQYQIKNHKYLEDTGWNHMGFLSHYNNTPEIDYSARTGNFNMVGERLGQLDMPVIGSINIYPADYATVVEEDQRIHTIINSLGSVGGIISLMIGVEVLLFGFRPKSPWGIVQRWSYGVMRRSLDRSLVKEFGMLDTPVPFVRHVHDRFVDTDKTIDNRIDESNAVLLENQKVEDIQDLQYRQCLMEKRMELTEQLLEAYYINGEVFKELDSAIRHRKRDSALTVA
ncbi:hypothetical protein CLU79DRAFT_238341 [Phycomyces nitens]|nr:hypothetical protein CLU79DRAFT_238341 [Phycomyces nitens]